MNSEILRKSLESAGLNLLSVLDAKGMDDPAVPADCESLLLIGSAGTDLWRKLPADYRNSKNPIDDYSTKFVENLMRQQSPGDEWSLLYPVNSVGKSMLNLQNLGRLAGWHNDSPLGNGINQTHGLWFAYRAVVALTKPLAADCATTAESPCDSCAATPCISACPAAALIVGNVPNLQSCVQYRTSVDSVCARNCLARLSCPVAPEWRYSDDQINYFYGRSLLSLREWVSNNSGSSVSDWAAR